MLSWELGRVALMLASKAPSSSLGDSQHDRDHPGHVPVGWRSCLASFLEVLRGLDPPSGLLGHASTLSALHARWALGQIGPGPTK